MATDEEQLLAAGIDPTSGGPASEAPSASAPSPESNVPAQEMFELAHEGKSFKFPTNLEFQISHNNQVQKVPYSQLINNFRQSAHLQETHKKFGEEKKSFEQQRAELQGAKAFKDKYGPLQEWSEKNPKDWQVIWDLYQNKSKHLLAHQTGVGQPEVPGQVPGNQPNLQPFVDKISQLEKTIEDLNGFKSSFEQKQQEERQQADVQMVKGEVQEFQKKYPEINLEETDPDGVKLWAKIIHYGVQEQLPTFRAAALAYLEPRMVETVSARARNQAVQGIKADRQQGIIAKSSKPFSQDGQSASSNGNPNKGKSWGELGEEARRMYTQISTQN